MKSNLRYEYNKLSMLTKMEIKRIFNQIPNTGLLVLLLVLFVNMFIFLSEKNEININHNIAICIEDNSIEVKTLIKNITENKLKEIVNFEETTLDKGLKLLKNGEVIAVIHVDEGTAEMLNYGKASSFKLYIKDPSNITVRFLINYLQNLVKVLNEGQSGAMIYWNIMKTEGFNFDQRIDELNKIAINYMSAFLTRGRVFQDTMKLEKFYGVSVINYYFATSLLLISIISAIMFHLDINDDIKKGRIIRLVNSGFNHWHIYSAKIIAGLIFSTLLLVAFKVGFMFVFNIFNMSELIRFFIFIIIINVIIHMMVIIIYFLISSNIIRDLSFISIFLLLSLSSGIIFPLTSMSKFLKTLSILNILTIGHSLLLGDSLTLQKVLVIAFYYFMCIASISYIHKKRSV